ncbi:MAG: hypothetical protein ACLR5G_14730 [Eubacteriales bacterium]
MLGIVFAVIVVISFIFAIFSGNLCNMSGAILDAAGKAVTTTLTLVGAMSLWSGVMETLREAGAIRRLSRMLSPLTRVLPGISAEREGRKRRLRPRGNPRIGNAATPLAIDALRFSGICA